MKKYLFLTDLHLDMVGIFDKINFIRRVKNINPHGIFITGDICNGFSLIRTLKLLSFLLPYPIYFVNGNHHYYGSSFSKIHDELKSLCSRTWNLKWLTEESLIELNKDTCLIGIDGWNDGLLGVSKYLKYSIDFLLIKDFKKLSSIYKKVDLCNKWAERSAILLEKKLTEALKYKNIFILTHYPPFREATNDDNKILKDFWLSFNINSTLGLMIKKVMENKSNNLTIFCGHTHVAKTVKITENITCEVGASHYFGLDRSDERIIQIL
jgi:predicted phosphohydrolase